MPTTRRGKGQGRGGRSGQSGDRGRESDSVVGDHQEEHATPQPNVEENGAEPTLASLLQQLTQAITTGIGNAQPPVQPPPIKLVQRDPMENFLKRNPMSFAGRPGTEKPEDWLENMENVLGTLTCSSEQRVVFATFMLQGEASKWWKAEKRTLQERGVQGIQWETFLAAFNDKYFPPSVREAKVVEFLSLEQGSMTVDEYDAKFTELARYAPRYFDDEYQRARKFERGLSDGIKFRLTALKLPTYAEVLDRARIIEKESAEFRKKKSEKKRNWEESAGQFGQQSGTSSNGNKKRFGGNGHGRGGHQQFRGQHQNPPRNFNPNQSRGANHGRFRNQAPNTNHHPGGNQ